MMKNILASCFLSGFLCWASIPSLSAAPPPVTISTAGVDAADARILVLPGGTAVAVWVENGVVTSRHTFFSQTWSSPPDVISGSVASSPAIAQDSSGNIVAVWVENGVINSSIRSTGGTWSSSTTLSSSGASEPRIAVDPNGNAVATWTRGGTIESSSMPSGGSWSSVSVLSGANADKSSVSMDPNGNATAAWTQVVSGVSNIYSASQPFGLAWTTASLISSSTIDSANVRVASYPNGNAIAIWYRYVASGDFYSNVFVQYATWSSGGGWASPVDLSAAGLMNPTNLMARIRVDGEGNAYAFWTTSYDGSQIVIQTASALSNQAFSSPLDLISSNPLVFGFDAAGESGGSHLLAWMALDTTSSTTVINAMYHTALGNWVPSFLVSAGGENAFPRVSVLKDSNFLYLTGVWLNYNGSNTVVQAEYITQPRIQPPSAPAVVQQTNNYTIVSEVSNNISWTASPTPTVSYYIIYRNGTSVGQVASSVLSFQDHNQVLNESVTYSIVAVNDNGVPSIEATVNFP